MIKHIPLRRAAHRPLAPSHAVVMSHEEPYASPKFLRYLLLFSLGLSGCASAPIPPSDHHLEPAPAIVGKVPDFISAPPLPPPPQATPRPELYSVVVHNINVDELLFALARDAKVNVDIHPGISGTVTMNVLDQTLPEILDRIMAQVDMRYEISGKNLSVMPDSPYLKNYRIDYPNIQRDARSSVNTSTSLGASGTAPGGSAGSSGGVAGNNSSMTSLTNTTNNRFWDTLIANLRDILRETDKILPEGSSETVTEQSGQQTAIPQPGATGAALHTTGTGRNARSDLLPGQLTQQGNTVVRRTTYREAASVIANAESGLVTVRATARQHTKIREFLDTILRSAHRQVLIEATIVEVDLSDRFQQGIDWSIVRNLGSTAGSNITLQPTGSSTGLLTGGLVSSLASMTWKKSSAEADISAALKLLESFGTLRVLSSPKISVLNSQTSLLKVVDNEVYFTITVTPGTAATATTPAVAPTYSTTMNTVPIGFLMTVTPQISENGEVILNLRPTISRISGYAMDPNPVLAENRLSNPIPIVQTREMESVMRVQTGDIAILGGLMQDTRNNKSDEVPLLNQTPYVGNLFKYKDSATRKSELVVFLRPTILTDASLEGDYKRYRHILPEARSLMSQPEASSPSTSPSTSPTSSFRP